MSILEVALAQRRVTVSVPATVANLGPGLETVPRTEANLVVQGAAAAFKVCGRHLPSLRFICEHRIPFNKGLGAASASFVGGFLAASVLSAEAKKEEGGRLEVESVERRNAIFNVGRSALLINCFATQDFAKFQKASEDFLASPTILEKFPHIRPVSQAALAAGASGACACGYGPSVMALIQGRTGDVLAQSASNQLEQNVGKAMLTAGEECLVNGQILIAKPVDVGAHVVAQKSTLGQSDEKSRIVYFQ
ncbi:thrB [Symbiodinium sp. CCMP2592]|nr:thrB [Symbiodinium sp. CCMP2592]